MNTTLILWCVFSTHTHTHTLTLQNGDQWLSDMGYLLYMYIHSYMHIAMSLSHKEFIQMNKYVYDKMIRILSCNVSKSMQQEEYCYCCWWHFIHTHSHPHIQIHKEILLYIPSTHTHFTSAYNFTNTDCDTNILLLYPMLWNCLSAKDYIVNWY